MPKTREVLRSIAQSERSIKSHMDRLGCSDLAQEAGIGDDLFEGKLARYALLERFVSAILASQTSVHLDPPAAAEFAGRRALAMMAWLDEHESEVDEAVLLPTEQ